ncbi:MAG: hypothetical protein HYR97_00990 [Candidatus Melainabacteria bacterium]|nr:hypothetical protein [Candidatus Melainabacteria bacterium]
MTTVNSNNAFKLLQDIVTKSTGANDDEITRGEVRRLFDSDKDGFVSNKELNDANMDLLRLAANDLDVASMEKDVNKRAQLERAQKFLQDLLRDKGLRQKPPGQDKIAKVKDDPLVRNPYDLPDKDAMTRWSRERNSFIDQRITLDLNAEKNNIQRLLSETGSASGVVKALWTNDDSIGGKKTNVLRMNELIGAWALGKTNPAFRKEFITEMARYVNDKNNGLDPQFVLDSLLQVIQSTDFTGQEDLQNFLKEIAIEIAKTGDFAKRGDGVIANYDASNEGGVFGSLVLVKNGDKFEFIEHDPGNQARKTKYILENKDEALKPGGATTGGFAPGSVSSSPTGDKLADPSQLQDDLNGIKKDLDKLKEKVKNNPLDKEKFDEATKGLNINIPSLIKAGNIRGLQDLIGNLKALSDLAKRYGLTDLGEKIDKLIKDLETHVNSIQSKNNSGFAPGTPEVNTPPTEKTNPPPTIETDAPPITKTDTPPTTKQDDTPPVERNSSTTYKRKCAPKPRTRTTSTTRRSTTTSSTRRDTTVRHSSSSQRITGDDTTRSNEKLEVRWGRDGNTLIHDSTDRYGAPVYKMFRVHSTHQANGRVESKWYEIMDRDLQHPYTFQAGKGKIHYLVPYDDDSRRDFRANKLPETVRNVLKDSRLKLHILRARGIAYTSGYAFVSHGGKIYFSRDQRTWHSTDPNDTSTYNVIQRGVTVTGIEKNK